MFRLYPRIALFFALPFALLICISSIVGRALHGDVLTFIESNSFVAHINWLDMRVGIVHQFYPITDAAYVYDFSWSPNGQMMAILAGGDEGFDTYIVVVDSAGNEITRIVNAYAQFEHPTWYPNNETLLFKVYESAPRLYSANIHTPNDWQLFLEERDDENAYYDVSLSPDGTQLLYTLNDENIYVANADGSDERLLVEFGYTPHWSPDGQSILFDRFDSISNSAPVLYTFNLDRGEQLPLFGDLTGSNGVWSADESQIAFMSEVPRSYTQIFVVNANGGSVRQVTFHSNDIKSPQWMP
jgi:Tol biopolymer transport system component